MVWALLQAIHRVLTLPWRNWGSGFLGLRIGACLHGVCVLQAVEARQRIWGSQHLGEGDYLYESAGPLLFAAQERRRSHPCVFLMFICASCSFCEWSGGPLPVVQEDKPFHNQRRPYSQGSTTVSTKMWPRTSIFWRWEIGRVILKLQKYNCTLLFFNNRRSSSLLSSGTVTRRTFSPIGLVSYGAPYGFLLLCLLLEVRRVKFQMLPMTSTVHFIIKLVISVRKLYWNIWCQLNCRLCSYLWYFVLLFYHIHRYLICLISSAMGWLNSGSLFGPSTFSTQIHRWQKRLLVSIPNPIPALIFWLLSSHIISITLL